MATTTAFCTSAKAELPQALHNFTNGTGNTFKGLLIKVSPTGTYGAATTNVGTPGTGTPSTSNVGTDEVSGTGYTSGGVALTNVTPAVSGTGASWSFSPNPSWTGASFSCTAFVIYNSTNGGRTVSTHDLGGTQTVTSGTLTILMPSNTPGTAIESIQ